MEVWKRYSPLFFEIIFLVVCFFITILPLRDFDLWFHLKSGEVIMQKGIINYDVFSHSAQGRPWFPYEWLFQVSVYNFKQIFSLEAIAYLMALVATVHVGLVFLILKKVFNLNWILSLALSFVYMVSIYEFLTARPHLFAYTFLLANLFLVLLYYFKNKNFLWVSFPITLAWANLHGSIFLDIAFFFGYGLIALINSRLLREKEWLKKARVLGIYGVLTAILTILPPLGFMQYELLWKFFWLRKFISSYIDEWTPLNTNIMAFVMFTSTVVLVLLPFLIINFKKKNFTKNLWVIPLLPFLILPYMATRNVFLGYISLILILGWCLTFIKFTHYSKILKTTLLIVLVVLIGAHIGLLKLKRDTMVHSRYYYPVNAAQFIKRFHLQGNMFNEYGYGGYLLYELYPQQKVFLDGRTDVYLCCEMPDTLDMAKKKNLPDSEYKKELDKIWNKYNISFVLLRTEKHTMLRKIERLLANDPDWNLVFWDDDSQLFVRRDGKNEQILSQFMTVAATPYERDPYRSESVDKALSEYQRMIKTVDSARSRNAIGYILLQKKDFDGAKSQFEQAVNLDPTFESPYMNLAELAAKDNDLNSAITLYQKAKAQANDRGLIYIRLGQLTLQRDNNLGEAKKIWLEGIQKTVDDDAREKLKKLLSAT